MLLSHCGSEINQEALVEAAEIRHSLEQYGMIVPEMGKAVSVVAPQLGFWYKEHSVIEDLELIIGGYKYPVGVEWQGVFYEDDDGDIGHYSVVTNIDRANKIITLSDPYGRFAGTDRSFHIDEFESRWWDENEVWDEAIGGRRLVRDEKMMFIVTPKFETFPYSLGMKSG